MVLKRVKKSDLDNLTYIFNRFIGYGVLGNYWSYNYYWSMLASWIWDAFRISNKKRYATCLSHIYCYYYNCDPIIHLFKLRMK